MAIRKTQAVANNYGPAVNIGANQKTVEAASAGVLAILNTAHTDEKTKRAALAAFSNVCSVNNSTIFGCHFQTGTPST